MPKVSSSDHKASPTMLVREQYKNQVHFGGRDSNQSARDFSKIDRKSHDSRTDSRKKFEEEMPIPSSRQQVPVKLVYILSIEKKEPETFRNPNPGSQPTNLRTSIYLFHTSMYGILTFACLLFALRTGNGQLLEHLWEAGAGYLGLEATKGIFQGFKGISLKIIRK